MDCSLRVEYADVSLLGGREENQDRVAAAVAEHAALLLVVDGMGGHAHGASAAEVTRQSVLEGFWRTPQPLFDPLGFLHLALGRAHEEVVKLGEKLPLEQRPRATCALCLIQQGASWWAHVGDSRIYHLRGGSLLGRSRDHSHVEGLLREGLITADQAQAHPMRNFVECCLGGDPVLPDMSLTRRRALEAGDVLLVCTDGFWSGLKDPEIAEELSAPAAGAGAGPASGAPPKTLKDRLTALGERAIARTGAASDNTSVAALRWLGDGEPRA
jgi:serine/threonine protein phosphatase PrpC